MAATTYRPDFYAKSVIGIKLGTPLATGHIATTWDIDLINKSLVPGSLKFNTTAAKVNTINEQNNVNVPIMDIVDTAAILGFEASFQKLDPALYQKLISATLDTVNGGWAAPSVSQSTVPFSVQLVTAPTDTGYCNVIWFTKCNMTFMPIEGALDVASLVTLKLTASVVTTKDSTTGLSISPYGSYPCPAAPVQVIVDTVGKTVSGAYLSQFTWEDMEWTKDGGTTWTAFSAATATLPAATYAAGKIGIRAKAVAGVFAAGVELYTTAQYIISA